MRSAADVSVFLFSDMLIPKTTDDVFYQMQTAGMTPIITHPERNMLLQKQIEKLEEWVATNRPPYTMLLGLPAEQPAAVKRLLSERLRRAALPSTVIASRDGTVLEVMEGVPTVSDLRVLADGTSRSR